MKCSNWSWDALLVASIVIVAGLCAQSPQTVLAQDEDQPEGKIVRISPDAANDSAEESLEAKTRIVEKPAYWIGISGRNVQSPVLRTQFQLAEDLGVVVEQVVPDSPADKAGLLKYDIILRANGEGVYGMKVLQDHVRAHQAEPLELKLIRLGKEETVVVVPEERPAEIAEQLGGQGRGGWNGLQGRSDGLRKLLEQWQQDGELPGGIRMFGPGMVLQGQQFDVNAMPGGVAVSVQREEDGPAKITVKQGDQTWQITGDDPESLKQLPEELRPFVERMLNRQGEQQNALGLDWEAELENLLPRGLGGLHREPPFHADEISKRMQRLEQQLQELRKQLSEQEPDLIEPQ